MPFFLQLPLLVFRLWEHAYISCYDFFYFSITLKYDIHLVFSYFLFPWCFSKEFFWFLESEFSNWPKEKMSEWVSEWVSEWMSEWVCLSLGELLSSCSSKSRGGTIGRDLLQTFTMSSGFFLYLPEVPLALTSAMSQICPKAVSPHETKNQSGI